MVVSPAEEFLLKRVPLIDALPSALGLYLVFTEVLYRFQALFQAVGIKYGK